MSVQCEEPVPVDLVVDRAQTIEWVRRRLGHIAPDCSDQLALLLAAVRTSERARRALVAPSTFDWLDTMVLLIDRDAPELLPDGQFAAHTAAVVNLTAGLDDSADRITVRCDARGRAVLPILGLVVSASKRDAGRTIEVSLASPRPGVTLADDVAVASAAKGTSASQGVGRPQPVMSLCDGATDVEAIVARWTAEGGALASTPIPQAKRASDRLSALLMPIDIPTTIEPNSLQTESIRQDATFDHLSLLAVRQPSEFAAIAAAVENSDGRYADVLRAHCDYISERYDKAAAGYAALLVAEPSNTDLWRDLCWALRHSGREEITRVWVFHPAEVVQTAQRVSFVDGVPHPEGSKEELHETPLAAGLRFLDWIADDLG